MDYFDILLAKKLSGGGGGGEITVEGLTVNDNGTYTAPSGKAYSPVVVNLPLGEKAITANGEYNASADDLKGYSKVTVNVEGFKVKDMPTGAISSFDDGTDNPLKELKVSIVPVQSGSGDPSPSNPRAISGWTGANVKVTGINILDLSSEFDRLNVNYTVDSEGWYTVPNVTTPNLYTSRIMIGRIITGSVLIVVHSDTQPTSFGVRMFDDTTVKAQTTSKSQNITFDRLGFNWGNTTAGTLAKFKIMVVDNPTIGDEVIPYNGTTTPISLGQTVYGGELDVTSGILKARPYYASYNGEPLVGPWISSLDEYEEGATPTTGAQVVDLGGTETTYQLTPTQVSSILGTNNIWADCGDVISGKYFASL